MYLACVHYLVPNHYLVTLIYTYSTWSDICLKFPPSALWCHLSSQFTQLNMYWFESSALNSLAQVFMHLDKSTASVFFSLHFHAGFWPTICIKCVWLMWKKNFAYLSCVDNEAQDWRLWGRVLKLKEWKGVAFVIERKYIWRFFTRFTISFRYLCVQSFILSKSEMHQC